MSIVRTDLRNTRERAKEIRFYPAATVGATNVQDAIEEVEGDVIIAGTSPPQITPKIVTFAMSPYTVLPTDYLLLVDTTGGAVVLNMGLASDRAGRRVTIKDDVGNSAVNNITINRAGGDLVDGATSYVLDGNFAAATLDPKTGGYTVT
jgi:hypothetical protein